MECVKIADLKPGDWAVLFPSIGACWIAACDHYSEGHYFIEWKDDAGSSNYQVMDGDLEVEKVA